MYWINEQGEIFSDYTKTKLKQYKGVYKNVTLIHYREDGSRLKSTQNIHVLVAKAFVVKSSEEKNWVNHIDGNKWNNKSSNLEWVTAKENTSHAISTGLMKPSGSDHPMFGKTHTKEARKKLSDSRKGNPRFMGNNHPRSRAVVGTHLETGEQVFYESSNMAATAMNISQGNIGSVLNGNRHSCGGYHWTRVE